MDDIQTAHTTEATKESSIGDGLSVNLPPDSAEKSIPERSKLSFQHGDSSIPLPSYMLEKTHSAMLEDLPFQREEDETPSEHMFSHRLLCIEYPGVVENEDKALKTLGGIQNISLTHTKRNRRLELRFRPDDYYCKPACASKHETTALLISVKVRRHRNKPNPEALGSLMTSPVQSEVSYNVTVLGSIDTTYRFKNLCDFQYVPSDGHTCIYETLMPKGIPSRSWLLEDTEYFLPPAAFSRMDNVQMHLYSKEKIDDTPQHIIGCTRQKRSGHAIFVDFLTSAIPSEPRPNTLKLIRSKNIDGDRVRQLAELFKQRPVWSKSALMVESTLTKDQMKFVLPAVSYYFVNGPWRVMWVRFGYDPRINISARNYQTLDFRLRTAGGLKTKVKAKRSYTNYLLPYKSAPLRSKVRMISRPDYKTATENVGYTSERSESGYIFRPGTLPPSRQMFYQYCDLHVPEIEAMLEKLPTPPPTTKCHPRRGWMPPGIDDQCRTIINNLVLEKLLEDVRTDSQPEYGLSSEADVPSSPIPPESCPAQDDQAMHDYESN